MKSRISLFTFVIVLVSVFSGCTTYTKTMREPNVRVNLVREDFDLSDQVSAEAKSVKILGIDWARLFTKRSGSIDGPSILPDFASIPVIGSFISDRTSSYALYEMMKANPGYDVVFYPQYEKRVLRPVLGLGFISKTTKVKVTARLGKLDK